MASTIQIVPKFQHPHVESYIYDNTRYEDIPATEVDDSIKLPFSVLIRVLTIHL